MGTYKLILKLKEQGLFDEGIRTGVIPFNYSIWFEIYELYLKESERETRKMQRYSNVSQKFRISERHVKRIIDKMNG